MTAKNHNPPAPDARVIVAQILTAATGLQVAIEGDLQAPMNTLSKPLERPSNQSKISTDPDLHAFIHARTMTATFASVVADETAGFPPEKHIRIAGLHRWWHRHGKHQPSHPTARKWLIPPNPDTAAQFPTLRNK
jgi:hypothetical protein